MSEFEALRKALPIKVLGALIALSVFAFSVDKNYRNNLRNLESKLKCSSDAEGYYQYLPTLVDEERDFMTMDWAHDIGNGKRLNMFMIGIATMQSPAFFLTKTITGSEDYFGGDYFMAMAMMNAFYVGLAFLLLFIVLAERYSRLSALVALILIFFGTNVVFYTSKDPVTSHMFVFSIMSVFVFLAHRWTKLVRTWEVAAYVLCVALLGVIRIPNIIFALIPFVLFAESFSEVKERFLRLTERWKIILPSLVFPITLWAMQAKYWHSITGKWFVSTYSYKGEGFVWNDPHFFDVLFSHQNGFFVYAPIMLIPVAVMILSVIRKQREHIVPLAAFVFIWVLYSFWWCWWLGGSYGHRGFVDIMPLLVFPTCAFIDKARGWPMRFSIPLALAFIYLLLISYNMCIIYGWPWEGDQWSWEDVHEKWEDANTRIWRIYYN